MNKLPLTPSLDPQHIKQLIAVQQIIDILENPNSTQEMRILAETGLQLLLETHQEEKPN